MPSSWQNLKAVRPKSYSLEDSTLPMEGGSRSGNRSRSNSPNELASSTSALTIGSTPIMSPSPSITPVNSRSLGNLRVQVISAKGLTGKDRNGLSDPFVVVNLPGAPPPSSLSNPANNHPSKRDRDFYRRTTPVQPKTLEPSWKEQEATFEWEITPEWYGPQGEAEVPDNDDDIDVDVNETDVKTRGGGNVAPPGESMQVEDVEKSRENVPPTLSVPGDTHSQRPSNVRKLSGAATKILGAPVRMTTRGAVATTRAVRKRGKPRPMRLRPNRSQGHQQQQQQQQKIPSGSAQLNAGGQAHSCVGSVEFVIWDKDKWSGNDYLGECSLQVAQWVPDGASAAWSMNSEPIVLPILSSRRNAKVSGELVIRIGLVSASASTSPDELYLKLLTANRVEVPGVRSVPANQSVGTSGPAEAFVDDGLSSDSESEIREELLSDNDMTEDDLDDDDEDGLSFEESATTTEGEDVYDSSTDASRGPSQATSSWDLKKSATSASGSTSTSDSTNASLTNTASEVAPTTTRKRVLPRKLQRDRQQGRSGSTSDAGVENAVTKQKRLPRAPGPRRKKKQERSKKSKPAEQRKKRVRTPSRSQGQTKDFAFKSELGMEIIGIVQMEVKGAQDLPRWKNSLGTSFDMDGFVIVSFGQKIFRTRVARHTLNPTWDEKLLFHVRRHEANFVTKLAIYDWDKLSSNDFVGATELKVDALIEAAPKPDPETGLYNANDDGMHDMIKYALPLGREDDQPSGKTIGRHAPILTVEAKFTPYEALRQRFWRQLLMQYDTDDSGRLSSLEMASMLDSLGSTLSSQTIDNWFAPFDKQPDEGHELTIDEAIMSLEREIKKPWSEKRYAREDSLLGPITPAQSGTQTPASITEPSQLSSSAAALPQISTENASLDMSGPAAPPGAEHEHELAQKKVPVPSTVIEDLDRGYHISEPTQTPLGVSQGGHKPELIERDVSGTSLTGTSSTPSEGESQGNSGRGEQQQVERVIVLKSCPLCHMPRLSKKAEVDIVTHLAVCASQDWRRVDSMVVGNFVTASQAHRKWYTKALTKISQGQYQLGANSANIIVQDRITGELLEEKMQVYVRLGIRLLYKGARSRMEGARIRRMLQNMSIKQGQKYDSPLSAREIPQFVAFHNLNLDEVRDPLDSFKTFNQFFYRKLKEGARPVADPEDPTTLVSSADCRLMAFASVDEATKIWIKGREFTMERLLGDSYKGKLDNYQDGGGMVIFRLAPQDYHRFHVPADAVVGEISFIKGRFYTVNPMAIRSTIDVYGENVRAVVPFHSECFGTFYCVCIGAMMVGSINLTVKKGDRVKRGDEFGYYAFGGSTNVCVFEKGAVEFDEDLLTNSRAATETLVRVGMRIGKAG